MTRRLALAAALLLSACGSEPPPEEPVPDPTVADFAGSWDLLVTFAENFDTVRAELSGSAAANDWVMINPGYDTVRMSTVSLKGDSMILVSDEFTAVVVPNATAQVRTATVRRGDVLEGNAIATFRMADGSQQVRTMTLRATRQ